MPIDFVIPWVDGRDPEWAAAKARVAAAAGIPGAHNEKWIAGPQRWRDWDLLRYWFRGVERFAPWVRRIHFVTYGHLPAWLDASHPKLHVVNHRDFIPAADLPTFSSRAIDVNLHRIPGLAERFVYFNDDMFLTAPTEERDFFRRGLPCDAAIISPIHLRKNGVRAEINALYEINARFRKRAVLLGHPLKWFAPCYGTALVRTFLMLPFRLFTGFYVSHLPTSFLKSTFETVWREIPDVLARASAHRFRDDSDVNQWLFEYWQFATGAFTPRNPRIGVMFEGRDEFAAACASVRAGRRKIVCWNDGADIDPADFERMRTEMREAFEALLPGPSSYERDEA